jgi:hypothetical protein
VNLALILIFVELQTISCTPPSAPLITTNPSSAIVLVNTIASFSAEAIGYPEPDLQWQVSSSIDPTAMQHFVDIVGATTSPYSFVASLADSSTSYRAVFSNTIGNATSSIASLVVLNSTVASGTPNPLVAAAQKIFDPSSQASQIYFNCTIVEAGYLLAGVTVVFGFVIIQLFLSCVYFLFVHLPYRATEAFWWLLGKFELLGARVANAQELQGNANNSLMIGEHVRYDDDDDDDDEAVRRPIITRATQ